MDSNPIMHLLFLVLILFTRAISASQTPANPISRITVVGVVYCDTCQSNRFSKHSYFLPGVDVHLQCKFKATSPKTAEQMTFSVNRTTDNFGTYKLEIPNVDGVDCVDGLAISSVCQASLIGSSLESCNVPSLKTSTDEISVKSKQENLCIYSLNALSYKPVERNDTLCGANQKSKQAEKQQDFLPHSVKSNNPNSEFNSSKFFFPFYIPGYGWFFWPPLPGFPFPFPPLPFTPNPPSFPFPLPPLPFTPSPPAFPFPLPPLPFTPSPPPPSLPFPFPPLPPLFQAASSPPPPPGFNLGDPRTWGHFFPPPQPPSSSSTSKDQNP